MATDENKNMEPLALKAIENDLGDFSIIVKEQKKIRRRELHEKKKELEQIELEEKRKRAQKGMTYLLAKSMKYSHFFKDKLEQHIQVKTRRGRPTTKIKQEVKALNTLEPKLEDVLCDSMFKEDANNQQLSSDIGAIDIMDQLKFFEGGVLKPYQIEGLTWMTILFENGVNGILADEMGLGKTVQVIALICHLYERKVEGPYLIVVPLSTVPNWESEFHRFAPKIPVVVFHGSAIHRREIAHQISRRRYTLDGSIVKPVIITTYQAPLVEATFLSKYRWQYIIVDEGHRLKNHRSRLGIELRNLKSINRLLLTGTPLQNNLTELWALLNFLVPHIFTDMDTFASLFLLEDMRDDKIVKEEESKNMIATIHKVLAPFMLRRLKCEVLQNLVPKKEMLVYCPMTKLQRDLYTYIIERNIAMLRRHKEEDEMPRHKRKRLELKYLSESTNNYKEEMLEDGTGVKYLCRITMQNTAMMFKKTVDHPYLVHFPLDPKSKTKELLIDDQLVAQSGKMLVLHAMLAKLKQQGHKVLIFSTLVMLLDLIEEYVIMRGYQYGRLDGSLSLEARDVAIRDFNSNPDTFLFLISTRAGGLGLNLTAADTVIFYDRDWNPQVDIQAQDRCHRIGQTKPVMVYTLVTKNTIDERIIQCGEMKRRLEKIVIKDGKFKSIKNDDKSKTDIDFEELKQLLESSNCSTKIHSNGYVFTDKELSELLDRSELYKSMEKLDQTSDQNGQ